ncbi:hypothetical protein ACOKM5_03615 [Streptomyces sp. BH097]|uniref:hypothetical protein n=1 Tax=unclassified Streptomyces TaxID=2593676 RepID=UPI003BB69038
MPPTSMPPRDRHPPVEDLALVALNEDAASLDTEHVLACRVCLSTLGLLVRVARAARSGPAAPAEPPSSTWQAIRRGL